MLYAIVAILVILADQLIKLYVSSSSFQPMDLIPGVLSLTKVENDGAAFGFLSGENATMWFIIIAAVFTILVVIALATRFINGFLARWSIVLVAAGGVSNCIDRVINIRPTGHVVDMFQFPFAKSWFPVFNLADVFITVFCVVFILAVLFGRGHKRDEDLDDEFVEDEEEALEEEVVEPRPQRRSRKARKEELDEPEEDEAPAKPARGRKARQSKYDEEYEQYKAAQRAREEAEAAARTAEPETELPPTAYATDDPFAEWERANAAAQQPAPAPKPVQAPPARPAVDRSALAADPQYNAQPVQAAQPAPAPKPVQAPPARKPAPQAEEDLSFSLDDILAEFK